MGNPRASFIVLPALALGLACTAILNPRDDVQRCGSATDCEASGDNRYDVECVFPEESTLDSTEVDKVCVAEFKGISCDETGDLDNEDYVSTFDALNMGTRYNCDDTMLGTLGCPPNADGVCPGLDVNKYNTCDDGEGDPEIYMLFSGFDDLTGQDVRDAFCQSFFCDETFVCDTNDMQCVKCDESEDFGLGGCGRVFVGGAPSCVYNSNLEDECDGPEADTNSPKFGPC